MTEALTITNTLFNGAALACPHCGKGRLFSSYLKRVDSCPHCGENFVGLDADDGPAWLTIVLSTHGLWPVFMYLDRIGMASAFAQLAINVLVLTGLVLFILPRAKGLFIAHLWWLERRPGGGKVRPRHDCGDLTSRQSSRPLVLRDAALARCSSG